MYNSSLVSSQRLYGSIDPTLQIFHLQWKFIITPIEEMLQPNCDFKYRSIKYSTSASSLKKLNHRDNSQSRLSFCKENVIGVQRPKTSNIFKSRQVQKRWNNNVSTSSSSKLRLIANSSHMKRQCPDKQISEEEQQSVLLAKSHYITPYEDYYCNLHETFQALPPLLESHKLQTKQIKIQLQIIQERAEAQLKQTQQYFHHEISKLKALMGATFKSHSRQIINARQSMNLLHETLSAFEGKCLQISEQIIRLDDNFNS